MQYEYKVVPFRGQIRSGFTSTNPLEIVSEQVEQAINSVASTGWEFYSLDTVTLRISKGCLFGGTPDITTYDQIIFRRAR